MQSEGDASSSARKCLALEVSVMEKDAMWSVRVALAGESQHRLLGFWSNTRPSVAGNYYISFKKQHLCPIRPDRDKASDDGAFPVGAPELLPGNHMTV